MPSSRPDLSGVRALVFDLDGTLIDSKLDLALSVNATLAHLGGTPLDHERIYSFIGQGAPMLLRQALEASGTPADPGRALEFFIAYYRRHLLDHTVTYPGVREALRALAGWPLAVLSNKPVGPTRAILEGLGIAASFRFVYGGNSFPTKKPDPEGMRALLDDFRLGPREVMLVGDSEIDVLTARNAGTWCCGVRYGLGSHRLEEYPPDILVDSLAELPAALGAGVTAGTESETQNGGGR